MWNSFILHLFEKKKNPTYQSYDFFKGHLKHRYFFFWSGWFFSHLPYVKRNFYLHLEHDYMYGYIKLAHAWTSILLAGTPIFLWENWQNCIVDSHLLKQMALGPYFQTLSEKPALNDDAE